MVTNNDLYNNTGWICDGKKSIVSFVFELFVTIILEFKCSFQPGAVLFRYRTLKLLLK